MWLVGGVAVAILLLMINYLLTGNSRQNSVKPADQAKLRRAAEREGRRARRRKHREKEKKNAQADLHHEGQSTDEEETETDSVKFKAETSMIFKWILKFLEKCFA